MHNLSVQEAAARLGAPERRLLSVQEAAPLLGIAIGTLYHCVSQGRCPVRPIHRGRSVRFDLLDILEYVESLSPLDSVSSDQNKTCVFTTA